MLFLLDDLQWGLFNAWLLILPHVILAPILAIIYKKGTKRVANMSWYGKKEKIMAIINHIFYYGIIIISIWVPLQLTSIFFYFGLTLCIISLLLYIIAYSNYASTPPDKLVVKGMYKLSRNPLYFTSLIVFLGIIIASLSWIILVLTIIYIITNHYIILLEERYCLKEYGEEYQKYKEKVPRYFLFF